ncbi:hypothetical protein C8F04DRAFT_1177510 [Mycena alexandri]|uniref:Uncharacterized protein n=1 Tax=Mycena alexandri TaxID=1745969 RepID=A0AAD6T883_9AGAR|nr:hypothetical protein C8F04DRAFT_1177510 [Mycena alexandri]
MTILRGRLKPKRERLQRSEGVRQVKEVDWWYYMGAGWDNEAGGMAVVVVVVEEKIIDTINQSKQRFAGGHIADPLLSFTPPPLQPATHPSLHVLLLSLLPHSDVWHPFQVFELGAFNLISGKLKVNHKSLLKSMKQLELSRTSAWNELKVENLSFSGTAVQTSSFSSTELKFRQNLSWVELKLSA